MKDKMAPIVAIVVVAAAGAGLYIVSPSLQDPAVRLNLTAREHIEKAERLLTAYSQDLVRLSDLQRRTASLIVESTPTTQPETESLPNGVTAEQLTAVTKARPDALEHINDAIRDAFNDPVVRHLTREVEEEYVSAGTESPSPQMPEPRVSTSPEGLARLQSEVNKALAENKGRLKAAQREIQQAMALSEGTASGRDHPGVNRMAGIVEYHLAADALRQARLARLEAVAPRRRIVTFAQRHTAAGGDAQCFAAQQVGKVAEEVSQRREAVRVRLKQTTAELVALRGEIDSLKKQLSAAQNEAAKWSADLLDQESKGYPYDDVSAFTAFRARYLAAGKSWRDAVARADAILRGTLRNATIDDPDEYLTRPYRPLPGKKIVPDEGIVYREKDGEILADRKATLAAQVETLDAQIAALMKLAVALEAQRRAAAANADRFTERVRVDVARMTAAVNAAQALEDEALDHANKATRYFKSAASRMQQDAREANSAAQAAPPDAPNQRLELIGQNIDFAGHLSASAADALLIEATVHYERVLDLTQQRDALRIAEQAGIKDLDPAALDEAITAARDAGIEAVDGALDELEKASRDLKDHWTVTANRAAARYLGAQLGKEAYRKRAERLYATITQDQQDDPVLRPYVHMLNHIRRSR